VRSLVLPVLLFLAAPCIGAAPVRVLIPSQDGKLQIPGFWFEAKTGSPRPAVISLHGCGGPYDGKGRLGPGYFRDAGYFGAEGMHLLALDSFSPRGLKSVCEIPNARRTVTEDDRRDDVFAAIHWLAGQPGVDKSRIVILGRSHGAQTVLSVLDRTASAVRSQPIQPRAAIALYPGCSKLLKMVRYELGAPLLLMIGELDNWTPAKPCVALQEKLRRAQPDTAFELAVYPGSYHGFDGLAPVKVRKNIGNLKSGEAMVGGNPEARWEAHQRTFDFLSAQLGVPLSLSHRERFQIGARN
jgi:dienelactone hydrolase